MKRTNRAAPPNLDQEDELLLQGHEFIAGIDEAGRGALAGPVVAAAVILPSRNHPIWLGLVRDSKQLSPGRRQLLFDLISREAVAVGVGRIGAQVIDSINILEATKMAMTKAVEGLRRQPSFLLIDSVTLRQCPTPQRGITGGDRRCSSIACASIVAKVTRDHIMKEFSESYPGYGFARHKGYGTREHILSLRQLGPSPVHRLSFAPLRMLSARQFPCRGEER